MSNETCILTSKDFTILEIMRDRSLGRDDPLTPILTSKIESALVVFGEDVPANVATLSSRVRFSIDGQDPDTRVISHERMVAPVGMFLPISTRRGLALLGLAEGQEFRMVNHAGAEERIVLEKVHYQPETARREKEAVDRTAARKPALRLVYNALCDEPGLVSAGRHDDPGPGPSAA